MANYNNNLEKKNIENIDLNKKHTYSNSKINSSVYN